MNNMTALVSCFARACHRRANAVPVFDDTAAKALLGENFRQIAQNMQKGAAFFLPGFIGTPEEALCRIVDGQLAPSVLARSAFCEGALARETAQGCRQYVILAAGYDTFAIRNKDKCLAASPYLSWTCRRYWRTSGCASSAHLFLPAQSPSPAIFPKARGRINSCPAVSVRRKKPFSVCSASVII